ncbi:ATP-binding protein [Enterococcus alishanensis]
MDFEALAKVKSINQKCPIHHTHLIQFEDKQPFCEVCKKEQMGKEEQVLVDSAFKKYRRRKTIEVLEKDSIVGDEKLWQSNFDNYRTDNLEIKEALLKARRFAAEYMELLQQEKRIQKAIKESDDSSEKEVLNKQLSEIPTFNTIFTGVPGVGKSHLAMSMLQAINSHADPMVSCQFVSVNDLFRLIKSSFGKVESKHSELNMVGLLSSVDLLVIDDLGSEASFQRKDNEAGNYTQGVLFGILNSRQRTIITTNLNSDELEEIYNPKITSRLYKGVDGRIIKFTKATEDKRNKIKF